LADKEEMAKKFRVANHEIKKLKEQIGDNGLNFSAGPHRDSGIGIIGVNSGNES